ncbi:MAG: hypothetical protein K9M03_02525 [Kiritimatiellales bacterium]|nr:hypothetical protein [Kiritimatiellales bacterium]
MSTIGIIIGSLVEKAYADNIYRYCGILHPGDCGSGSEFVIQFFDQVGDFFAMLIAGAAVIATIYGGIKLIASGGNDQGKEDAKKIIIAALIGLILAIAAEAIMNFVCKFISGILGSSATCSFFGF